MKSFILIVFFGALLGFIATQCFHSCKTPNPTIGQVYYFVDPNPFDGVDTTFARVVDVKNEWVEYKMWKDNDTCDNFILSRTVKSFNSLYVK